MITVMPISAPFLPCQGEATSALGEDVVVDACVVDEGGVVDDVVDVVVVVVDVVDVVVGGVGSEKECLPLHISHNSSNSLRTWSIGNRSTIEYK